MSASSPKPGRRRSNSSSAAGKSTVDGGVHRIVVSPATAVGGTANGSFASGATNGSPQGHTNLKKEARQRTISEPTRKHVSFDLKHNSCLIYTPPLSRKGHTLLPVPKRFDGSGFVATHCLHVSSMSDDTNTTSAASDEEHGCGMPPSAAGPANRKTKRDRHGKKRRNLPPGSSVRASSPDMTPTWDGADGHPADQEALFSDSETEDTSAGETSTRIVTSPGTPVLTDTVGMENVTVVASTKKRKKHKSKVKKSKTSSSEGAQPAEAALAAAINSSDDGAALPSAEHLVLDWQQTTSFLAPGNVITTATKQTVNVSAAEMPTTVTATEILNTATDTSPALSLAAVPHSSYQTYQVFTLSVLIKGIQPESLVVNFLPAVVGIAFKTTDVCPEPGSLLLLSLVALHVVASFLSLFFFLFSVLFALCCL